MIQYLLFVAKVSSFCRSLIPWLVYCVCESLRSSFCLGFPMSVSAWCHPFSWHKLPLSIFSFQKMTLWFYMAFWSITCSLNQKLSLKIPTADSLAKNPFLERTKFSISIHFQRNCWRLESLFQVLYHSGSTWAWQEALSLLPSTPSWERQKHPAETTPRDIGGRGGLLPLSQQQEGNCILRKTLLTFSN